MTHPASKRHSSRPYFICTYFLEPFIDCWTWCDTIESSFASLIPCNDDRRRIAVDTSQTVQHGILSTILHFAAKAPKLAGLSHGNSFTLGQYKRFLRKSYWTVDHHAYEGAKMTPYIRPFQVSSMCVRRRLHTNMIMISLLRAPSIMPRAS